MCKNKRFDELRATLDKLCDNMSEMTRTSFTENFVINSLLRSAAAAAAEKNIKFSAKAAVPKQLDIPDDDLCVFIMNLTDNAIEACEKVTARKSAISRLTPNLRTVILS